MLKMAVGDAIGKGRFAPHFGRSGVFCVLPKAAARILRLAESNPSRYGSIRAISRLLTAIRSRLSVLILNLPQCCCVSQGAKVAQRALKIMQSRRIKGDHVKPIVDNRRARFAFSRKIIIIEILV